MANKSSPYKNPLLAEPWQIVQPDLIITSKADADSQNMKAAVARVLALFEHYSISPTLLGKNDAFEKLAISLAIEHVPGFKVHTGREVGRPNKWMRAYGLQFFWDVYRKAKERNGNYSWAFQQLAKQPPYNCYDWKTLQARFKDVVNRHPASNMMRYLVYGEKTGIDFEYPS